jgi:hypothetical protein
MPGNSETPQSNSRRDCFITLFQSTKVVVGQGSESVMKQSLGYLLCPAAEVPVSVSADNRLFCHFLTCSSVIHCVERKQTPRKSSSMFFNLSRWTGLSQEQSHSPSVVGPPTDSWSGLGGPFPVCRPLVAVTDANQGPEAVMPRTLRFRQRAPRAFSRVPQDRTNECDATS